VLDRLSQSDGAEARGFARNLLGEERCPPAEKIFDPVDSCLAICPGYALDGTLLVK